jgi:acid phosphatase (class B)
MAPPFVRLVLLAAATLVALSPALAGAAEARWLTLAAFQRTLAGAPPMTVVFDIDDTALYSTPAMLVAEGAFRVRHPDVARPYDDCRFFGAVNDSLDAKLSRPKTIATALVTFHAGRGDRIVFLTKRCASVPANDSTAHVLARMFGLRKPPTVRFTNLAPKVEALREEKPAISYGDADSDIEDTQKASALLPGSPIRAVRIIRTRFSSNPGAMNPGRFGEDVILDSEL